MIDSAKLQIVQDGFVYRGSAQICRQTVSNSPGE